MLMRIVQYVSALSPLTSSQLSYGCSSRIYREQNPLKQEKPKRAMAVQTNPSVQKVLKVPTLTSP
jgi:hypothetical protein